MNALTSINVGHCPVTCPVHPEDNAMELLLADKRSPETRRAYQQDVNAFFKWSGRQADVESIRWLCSLNSGQLALVLTQWKVSLMESCSTATVNRRLSAVRSLLRVARRLGATCADPTGLVDSEKVEAYRDTVSTGMSDAARLLSACDKSTVRGLRDYALLRLFISTGIRRAEALTVNVKHMDGLRLWIIAKGKTDRQAITLPQATATAIQAYLDARTAAGEQITQDSPLWMNDAPVARYRGQLMLRGWNDILERLSVQTLGRRVHPHALRHCAITAALDATGGDIRMVQRFSRHADVRTLQRYDDNRQDMAGTAARMLSDMLDKEVQA
jgi:integrase/recombinase XerC